MQLSSTGWWLVSSARPERLDETRSPLAIQLLTKIRDACSQRGGERAGRSPELGPGLGIVEGGGERLRHLVPYAGQGGKRAAYLLLGGPVLGCNPLIDQAEAFAK